MKSSELDDILDEFENDILLMLDGGASGDDLNEKILAFIILLFVLGSGYNDDSELTGLDREWLDEMFRLTISTTPGIVDRRNRGSDMAATALKIKNHALGAYHYALMANGAGEEEELAWALGDTEHCGDCFSYNALGFKPAGEWKVIAIERNHYPQSRYLECKGLHCDCRMVRRANQ